jgi:hypothetical protein
MRVPLREPAPGHGRTVRSGTVARLGRLRLNGGRDLGLPALVPVPPYGIASGPGGSSFQPPHCFFMINSMLGIVMNNVLKIKRLEKKRFLKQLVSGFSYSYTA